MKLKLAGGARSWKCASSSGASTGLSGAHLKAIERSVDTSIAAGRAVYGMLAVVAAFEADVRGDRHLPALTALADDRELRLAMSAPVLQSVRGPAVR